MRIFSLLTIFVLSFVLQSTVFQYISIFGVIPNTNLIFIILVGLFKDKKVGGIVGLTVGLLQDIIFGSIIGIHGLVYFIIGYTIGLINTSISKDSAISSFLLTIICTFIANIMFFFMYYFTGIDLTFIQMIKDIALIEAIYNAFLSILLFKLVKRLFSSPNLKFSRRG